MDTHTSTRLWTCGRAPRHLHQRTHCEHRARERDICQKGELKYSRRGEENNSTTPPSPSSPWTPASAPPSSRPQKTRPEKVNTPALISVRPHRVRIHLHFRWKGWQYKKPSCFWYVRVFNGPGMWERKWQGTPSTPHPSLYRSLSLVSSAACTGKQMKAKREAQNAAFHWNMGTKCCDPNLQKRRWLHTLLI